MMNDVTSADGTRIAYTRTGNGPALVLVDGALCYRASGPNAALAAALAAQFAVYTYDRRGRGDSTDTRPYSPAREIDDLAAIIDAAGGTAHVYGISSGAGLALAAANHGLGINKLAIYEAPFIVDDSRARIPADYTERLHHLTEADERSKIIKLFMTAGIGLPAIMVTLMRFMPAWRKLKSVAHTVVYDNQIVETNQQSQPFTASQWAHVTMPTVVIAGSKSPEWMRNAMRALAETLPNASHRVLDGQTHLVKAAALAPVLASFYIDDTPNQP
jgi:pimeloyl-ACP methyl ester carboxylesterase